MIALRPLLIAGVAAAAAAFVVPLRAQAPDATTQAPEQNLSEMIRRTILDNLPREFSGDSDWGHTREVTSGLKFNTDGGRLKIEKRTKEVNDGQWTQYKAKLIDPEQHLRVAVAQFRRTGPGRIGFVLYLSARLDGEVRYERWRRGIKMLNFKVDAQSTVEAALDCEVGFRLVPGKWLSDLVIEPHVKSVKLALVDVDLARISRIDGVVAEELGDRLRHSLDKQLRERQDEIARKLNAAIAARADKLRVSSDRLLALSWGKTQNMFAALAQSAAAPTSGSNQSAALPAVPSPQPVESPRKPAALPRGVLNLPPPPADLRPPNWPPPPAAMPTTIIGLPPPPSH